MKSMRLTMHLNERASGELEPFVCHPVIDNGYRVRAPQVTEQ